MRPKFYESPELAPGERFEFLIAIPADCHVAIDRDPPSAAHFDLERCEQLTAGELIAQSGGRVTTAGAYLRVRNKSGSPARFRFNATITPQCDVLERRIGVLVEDAYRRGGDAISEAELGAVIARAAARPAP